MKHLIPYFILFGVLHYSNSQTDTAQPRNLCLITTLISESCAGFEDKQKKSLTSLGNFSSSYIIMLIQNTPLFSNSALSSLPDIGSGVFFRLKSPFRSKTFPVHQYSQQSKWNLIPCISRMSEPKHPSLGHLSLIVKKKIVPFTWKPFQINAV